MKGRLISFEGLDGAGKTTQIDLLERWLIDQQIPCLRTCEPGGTDLGHELRTLLLYSPELKIAPLAEAFLFQADRAQHFAIKVIPALHEGRVVITDRCFDSSIAYQGIVHGLGQKWMRSLSLRAMYGVPPNVTFLLDLDPAQARARASQTTRFDQESEERYQLLREAFLLLAQGDERIKVIDAMQDPQVIHQQIVQSLA